MDETRILLHYHDISKILNIRKEIVKKGNSVIIIKHDSNILSYCDWIIELRPEGGSKGGDIIAQGIPETLKKEQKFQNRAISLIFFI